MSAKWRLYFPICICVCHSFPSKDIHFLYITTSWGGRKRIRGQLSSTASFRTEQKRVLPSLTCGFTSPWPEKPDGGGYEGTFEWVFFMDQTQELYISFQLIIPLARAQSQIHLQWQGVWTVVRLCVREKDGCPEHTCSLRPCLAHESHLHGSLIENPPAVTTSPNIW